MAEKNVRKAKNRNRKSINISMLMIVVLIVIIICGFVIKNQKIKEDGNSTIAERENVSNSYVEEIEDGIKINKSTKLNEAKEIEGLIVSNIQLTTESGMTTLLADVTNNSGARTEVKTIEITLLSEDGEQLTSVTGIINALNQDEKTQLNIAMTSDYINAYDFNINIK